MNSKNDEALAAGSAVTRVPGEKFADMREPVDRQGGPEPGWNPYDVWRTRVKAGVDTEPAAA